MPTFLGKDLYQIKVTLAGSKPPIWRRLIIPKSITLDKLHVVIQEAMGWLNCHLHSFSKGNSHYQELSDLHFYMPNTEESKGLPLRMLLCHEKDKMEYTYDMGDCWDHKILLEKSSLPDQVLPHVPYCIKGTGTCPAEDSCGIPGYYEKLEAVKDVNNPEREELREWLEQNIETRRYDLECINERLSDCLNFESEKDSGSDEDLVSEEDSGSEEGLESEEDSELQEDSEQINDS